MCFSAISSFSASIIIGGIGVSTVKKTTAKKDTFFASIPIIFAIQQFCEGFIWLSISNLSFAEFQTFFTYAFLFFAWSVWPALLPYSLYAMEENEQRKKFIYYLYLIGLGIGSASLYTLYSGQPFAYISSFHIDYALASPQSNNAFVSMYEIFYVLCTLAPMFISSVKNMKVFGILNVMALCISYIFFTNSIPSTWCFFAAILSGCIYWIIVKAHSLSTKTVHI
jgi:hypothetical protein